jgi:hypothetical protein
MTEQKCPLVFRMGQQTENRTRTLFNPKLSLEHYTSSVITFLTEEEGIKGQSLGSGGAEAGRSPKPALAETGDRLCR